MRKQWKKRNGFFHISTIGQPATVFPRRFSKNIQKKSAEKSDQHPFFPAPHKPKRCGEDDQKVWGTRRKRKSLKHCALKQKTYDHCNRKNNFTFHACLPYSFSGFPDCFLSRITSTSSICSKSTTGVIVPDFVRLLESTSMVLI